MKYKVGDKVKVKDIITESEHDIFDFVSSMDKYLGVETTIKYIDKASKSYQLTNCGNWWWSDDMLEDIPKTEDFKQVKCIDNAKGILEHITIGNYYKIEDESETSYLITNDEGIKVWYSKIRFEIETKLIFNIQDFRSKDIAINCETEEEAKEFFNILIMNGIDKWRKGECYLKDNNEVRKGYLCFDYMCDGLDYSTKEWYGSGDYKKYLIYDFKDIDFSNVWNKEAIDSIALNKIVDGYTFRDIITIIKEGEKFTDGITNISMNDNKIKVEDLNGIRLASYTYSEDYREFTKVEETKQVTICKVTHTSDSDKLKEFVLDSNKTVTEGEIVECQNNLTTCNWQYARVREVEIKYMTEDEFVGYKVCRKLS